VVAVGAVLALAASPTALRSQNIDFDRLADYVRRTMVDWQVPGVAIGVVRGDEVLFARGFGRRRVDRPDTVDTRTIFGNGSTTKAFTAALIGTLVDEGKLGWDDRVVDRLPGFALSDPWVTRETRIRDLLAHRTGVTASTYQLLEYWGAPTSRDELVRRLRFEPMGAGFRSRHIYHNITYTAAGSVAEAVTGRSWEALLEERLLAPLGMTASGTVLRETLSGENVASPHGMANGRVVAVDWLDLSNIGPAGSLSSNVDEMLHWLRMLLNEGEYEGRRVLSAAAVREMLQPVIPIPATSLAEGDFSFYALGWQVGLAYGRKVAMHTGSAQGFRAFMALVPEERLGIVILCNRHVSQYPVALFRHLTDRFYGPEDAPDRSAELLGQLRAAAASLDSSERTIRAARETGTSPALPLERYAGRYEIDLLNPSEIRVENGRLYWDVSPAFRAELEHWHHDVFRVARWEAPLWEGTAGMYPFVRFVLDPAGRPAEMIVDGVGRLRRR